MSLGKLLTLADFYHVSTDYLLCRTELRKHTNKSVSICISMMMQSKY